MIIIGIDYHPSFLGFELWIGDAAEIKTKRVRKQKTDREDARLLESNRVNCMGIDSLGNRVHMVRCEFALAKL